MEPTERLLSLWRMQDSLLQSHRAIFITAQSILLGLAASVAGPGQIFPAVLLVVPGAILVYAWYTLCNARATSESYLQMLVLESEEGRTPEKPLTLYHQFQSDSEYRDKVVDSASFKRIRWTRTRKLIDIGLPLVFAVLWVLLIAYVIGLFGSYKSA